MKKLYLLVTLAALLAAITSYATTWWRTFGGAERDEGTCVQQTTDGGYIVTGVTWSFGRPHEADIWLIKLDSLGHEEWDRTYEGGWGFSVRQTSDGGYIIAGSKLIKTDASGDTLWTRNFGANCVQLISDGGYILTGGGLKLMKVDENGDSIWAHIYQKSNYADVGEYVEETSDGGFIVVGKSIDYDYEEEVDKSSLWLLKTDAKGDTLWTRTYGGENWGVDYDRGNCVRQMDDGGYIITGQFKNSILIKTDENGDTIWNKNYGLGEGHCLQQTLDEGFIITGSINTYPTLSSPSPWDNLWLVKTDANGDTAWTIDYGGEDDDCGNYVQKTLDGGYILVGRTNSYGAGGGDLYLIKTDSLGLLAVRENPTLLTSKNWEVLVSLGTQITLRYWDCPQGFRASIYDALGRKVDVLESTETTGVLFCGSNYPLGVYFIQVPDEQKNTIYTARIIIIR